MMFYWSMFISRALFLINGRGSISSGEHVCYLKAFITTQGLSRMFLNWYFWENPSFQFCEIMQLRYASGSHAFRRMIDQYITDQTQNYMERSRAYFTETRY